MLFHGGRSTPALHSCYSPGVDVTWQYLVRHTNLIYGLELLAIVLFFEDSAPLLLQGSRCWVYVDNNNCLAALIRGDSNTDIIAVLVARFWRTTQRRDICVWFPRAKSTLNPADIPTRAKKLSFRARYSRGFSSSGFICCLPIEFTQTWPSSPPLTSPTFRKVKKGAQRPKLTRGD